jgi:hypothetical protein
MIVVPNQLRQKKKFVRHHINGKKDWDEVGNGICLLSQLQQGA